MDFKKLKQLFNKQTYGIVLLALLKKPYYLANLAFKNI